MTDLLSLLHDFGENSQFCQSLVGVRNQAITTDLVAGKGVLVNEHHVKPCPGQGDGCCRACRARTDDQHFAAWW